MNEENIKLAHDETRDAITTLMSVAAKHGITLSNDLPDGLFNLYIDDDVREMQLLKIRVDRAIKDIENGTFKRSEKILEHSVKSA